MASYLLRDGVYAACLVAEGDVAKRLRPLVTESGLLGVCHFGEVFLNREEVFVDATHDALVKALVGTDQTCHDGQHTAHVLAQTVTCILVSLLNHIEESTCAAFVVDLRLVARLVVGHIMDAVEEVFLGLPTVVVCLLDTVEVVLVKENQSRAWVILVVEVFGAVVGTRLHEVHHIVVAKVVAHHGHTAQVVDDMHGHGGLEGFVQGCPVAEVGTDLPCGVGRCRHRVGT